jgi:ferritin-like metal-binding protein YciE
MKNTSEGDRLLMQFFVSQLRDIYWAEEHVVKTLAKLARKSTTEQLVDAFESHRKETEEHVKRLERVFEMISEKAKAQKCQAMSGILEEANTIISDTEKDTMTRDVGLIFAGQKIEHYEIATYGGLATLAKALGYPDASAILIQTLEEEKSADKSLTAIARNQINLAASGEERPLEKI